MRNFVLFLIGAPAHERVLILWVVLSATCFCHLMYYLFFTWMPSPYLNADMLPVLKIVSGIGLIYALTMITCQNYISRLPAKWLQHYPLVGGIVFCLFIMVLYHSIGSLSLATGFVFAVSMVVGLIIFSASLILRFFIMGVLAHLVFVILYSFHCIPYAPIWTVPYSQHLGFYVNTLLFLSLPFLAMTVLLMFVIVQTWKARELAIRYMSENDALLNILNRRAIMQRIQQTLSDTQSASTSMVLVLFDVDDFKRINDCFGHTMGDDVLKEIVAIVRRTIHVSAEIGRYGGEEFVLFFKSIHLSDVLPKIYELQQAISRIPESLANAPEGLSVSASFGIYAFKADPTCSVVDVVHEADQRMYAAKAQGKNTVVWQLP